MIVSAAIVTFSGLYLLRHKAVRRRAPAKTGPAASRPMAIVRVLHGRQDVPAILNRGAEQACRRHL
jgi:hypothetical protein